MGHTAPRCGHTVQSRHCASRTALGWITGKAACGNESELLSVDGLLSELDYFFSTHAELRWIGSGIFEVPGAGTGTTSKVGRSLWRKTSASKGAEPFTITPGNPQCDSTVETFAAHRLEIDSWRKGVPFYIGKYLPVTCTEVVETFRAPPTFLQGHRLGRNFLRFRKRDDGRQRGGNRG